MVLELRDQQGRGGVTILAVVTDPDHQEKAELHDGSWEEYV